MKSSATVFRALIVLLAAGSSSCPSGSALLASGDLDTDQVSLSGCSAAVAATMQRSTADAGGGLCRQLHRVIAPIPGTLVDMLEGVFYDERARLDGPGCLLIISGSWSMLSGDPDPISRIMAALSTQGWELDPESSADGPDGTAFALTKGDEVCVVRGQWDGGDDGDSTYVPSDVYQIIVMCARHENRPGRSP